MRDAPSTPVNPTVPSDSAPAEPPRVSRASLAGRVRNFSPEAILVGLGLFVLLAAFAAADPNARATFSTAPFTDEAGNFVNARNFVQLGSWSTDEWNLHLVNLPFSLLEAIWFQIAGVGIVQARLAMIACTSIAAAALVWGLRDAVGRACATFGGLAFASSGLILFYGRLAFLEDLTVLGLTLGTLVLARKSRINLRGGVVSGICYAVAIGTKPSAAFAVAGILLVMLLVWGRHDRSMLRWIGATAAVIAVMGLLWAVAIWLPNRSAVAVDLKIWPPYRWNLTPAELVSSIRRYLTGGSDHVIGYLLLPLIALASAGLLSILTLRKRLGEAEAHLAAAAFAWAAFGFGILMIVSYRPNRYVVPLVPALAILAAIGLHLFVGWLGVRLKSRGTAAVAEERQARTKRLAPGLIVAAAIVVAVAPGLVWYGNWARSAGYNLVAIQNQFAAAVPAGEVVVGHDSALFLMRSKAKTVMPGLANNGDLYAQGARWYLVLADATAPTGVPDSVWASRERVTCASWRGNTTCLFHLH